MAAIANTDIDKSNNDYDDVTIAKNTAIKRQLRTYSDSDNSYEPRLEKKRKRAAVETIDFELHGDHKWGTLPFSRNINSRGMDYFVGLAHASGVHDGSSFPQQQQQQQSPDKSFKMNPLIDMTNTPLPLSFLNYFVSRSTAIPEFDNALYEAFGDSALVAIGMLVEEMITASLLPHAGLHVLRCRELENHHRPDYDDYEEGEDIPISKLSPVTVPHPVTGEDVTYDPRNMVNEKQATSKDDNESTPFVAWTLPPDEALLKVLEQGVVPDTGVAFWRDATRSLLDGQEANHRQILKQMCNSTFESTNPLRNNDELFQLFRINREIPSRTVRKPNPLDIANTTKEQAPNSTETGGNTSNITQGGGEQDIFRFNERNLVETSQHEVLNQQQQYQTDIDVDLSETETETGETTGGREEPPDFVEV